MTLPSVRPRRRRILVAGLLVGALLVSIGSSSRAAPASAQEPSAGPVQDLVERFAPVMMLREQDAACDVDGEPYLPASVDIVLDNPEIALRQVGQSNPVVMWGPGASDIAGLGEGFFLDFPGSSLQPGCIYELDARKYTGDRPPTVYAHVIQPPDDPGTLVIQYWSYWYYNDWNNKHESDWEGISLLFEASSPEEALASEPVEVGYSQHEGGERAGWNDEKLERDGDHPVVYSSAGSHASYYGSAVYLGRSASEGFGCDNTDGPSMRVDPEVVVLPDDPAAITDPDDPLAWVSFTGRWGERQSGPFNGPTGPVDKAHWSEPLPWFDDLRSSSVVIPAGDSDAASLVGLFCRITEGGSAVLLKFKVSPLGVLAALVVVGLSAVWLLRRTDWSRVVPEPVVARRRAGQILRAAAGIHRRDPRTFLAFGLVYLPAAIVTGLVAGAVGALPFVAAFRSVFGGSSATNVVMALLVGSLANTAAAVVVNALVADHLHARDSVDRLPGRGIDSARRTWERRRALVGGFARSFLIVAVLLISIVGLPWGVRQLIRYRFVPQTIAIEEASGSSSLGRSSEIVRGRWWHTATVVVALNGLVVVIATFTALLLLVVATGIPLWVFSALVSLIYAVVIPFAAIAMTLLYGDASAGTTDESEEALVPTPS